MDCTVLPCERMISRRFAPKLLKAALLALLAAVLWLALPGSVLVAAGEYSVRESQRNRTLVLAEDEVFVSRKAQPTSITLKSRIESQVPGSAVMEEHAAGALVHLAAPMDRALHAAHKDPVSLAAPDAEVLPVLYPKGFGRDASTRRIATRDILVQVPAARADEVAKRIHASAFQQTLAEGCFLFTVDTGYAA